MRYMLLVLILLSGKISAYQHEASICAIFNNEARFLKEWVDYHRLIGFDHFYLYNNNSQDKFREVLEPYIKEGFIDLFDWNYCSNNIQEWNNIQCLAYQHCIDHQRYNTHWLALIDLDEYIVPVQVDNIHELLKEYSDYACIGMNWQYYGTSKVEKIPAGKLMIEMLRWKAPWNSDVNRLSKMIMQPIFAHHIINPHWLFFSSGMQVNTDKIPYPYHEGPYVCIDKIRLNHYCLHDLDFMVNVKLPRYEKWGNGTLEILQAFDQFCTQEEDYIMERFVEKLNEQIQELTPSS
jgi:Glycosyltransferase family 92